MRDDGNEESHGGAWRAGLLVGKEETCYDLDGMT